MDGGYQRHARYHRRALFVVLLAACFVTDTLSVEVEVLQKEALVLPGQNVTFLCRVATHMQYCRAEIPGQRPVNLSPRIKNPTVQYVGKGLDNGDCGFTINQVQENNNGEVRCSIGLEDDRDEAVGIMRLIVAQRPKDPEMDLSRGTDRLSVYKAGDVLQASCIVRDGRPVANISWYLDDEPIPEHELSMPTIIDLAKENLQTQLQNLTRILQPTDNGRRLRCVAHHLAYDGGVAETGRILDVKYKPLEHASNPIDLFGYQLGQIGLISVDVEANPKPQIEWNIDGQRIKEGSNDNTGRIEAEAVEELGRGRYQVNLRIANINKMDTEKEYLLTAYNDMGSADYRVKISTSPEPEGVELGLGSIIGIVVGVCILLLVIVLGVFARVTGRWCFSGSSRGSHQQGETSDTESAAEGPKSAKKSANIFLAKYRRGKKDRIATEEQPEARTMNLPIKEHSDEEENKEEAGNVGSSSPEGLVYAELDLVSPNSGNNPVKAEQDKTEYAEIVYSPKDAPK